MGLFSKLFKKRPRIYYIEINDDEINKELSRIIGQVQKQIKDFKITLGKTTLDSKESSLERMYQLLITARHKLKDIEIDVDKIINIELQNSNYFSIKDQSFLKDKKDQISIIAEKIDEFINIIQQRPSAEEFKQELLDQLTHKLNQITVSMDTMIADDCNLKAIYKQINDL